MEMYDILADNYNRIFPLGTERINFVKSFLKSGGSILDIGCATGELCIELANTGYNPIGIDLNERMIEIAQNQKQKNIEFQVMNMLEIDKHYSDTQFSLIICFGNTLPHLGSLSEIADFYKQVYSCLTANGYFVFQILNYDKILMERKCEFPEIKNPDFKFTRSYELLDEKIRFTIGMEIDNKKMSDSTFLFPLKKEPAFSLLEDVGFKEIRMYKDYSLTQCDGKEFATLYVSQK